MIRISLADRFSPQARWIVAFIMACVALIVAVVFFIWAVSGFVNLRSIGLSGSVLAGLIAGIVVSTGLGAGLMALVFQSDRYGQDEAVYRASDPSNAPPGSSEPTRAAGPETISEETQCA